MIPFSPPHIDEKIIEEINKALLSGWITTGPRTKLFEKLLTEYSGHKATLCVNSASAGLELVLRWYGVKEGDEVIVPAYTYSATANVVIHCGAKPVFVDINENDFNISIDEIKKAITTRTKVIIPVDIAGYPCDYNEINSLVSSEEIKSKFNPETEEQQKLGRILILSDAAHSLGAKYNNTKAGNLTDVTVFSFHAVKNLTTAEGGAICLNLTSEFDSTQVYNTLNIKSLHGQNKDALAKTQIGNWEYDIIEPGYKCNMTDIQAAMGIVEIQRYDDDILVKRKKIFDLYSELLSKENWAITPEYETDLKKSSYHVFLMRVKDINEIQRNEIIKEIFNQQVAVNVHFKPLPLMSYYKSLGYDINNFPISYKNYIREISLPVYYNLSEENAIKVVKALNKAVNKILG